MLALSLLQYHKSTLSFPQTAVVSLYLPPDPETQSPLWNLEGIVYIQTNLFFNMKELLTDENS